MRRVLCRLSFLINVFLLVPGITSSWAQNPTYQLIVESGGYTDFKLHTLSQYDGGMTYTNWTRLKVVYKDTTSGIQRDKWFLSFKANTPEFESSVDGRTLPLNSISLFIESLTAQTTGRDGTLYQGPHSVSDGYIPLVENGDEGTFHIEISYNLDSPLLGHQPDYYITQLIFKMDTIPIP